MAALAAGEVEIIYVAPERLRLAKGRAPSPTLELLRRRGVSLLAVDEAHCISQVMRPIIRTSHYESFTTSGTGYNV
jgi:superfamily II DNA helicase RecQ